MSSEMHVRVSVVEPLSPRPGQRLLTRINILGSIYWDTTRDSYSRPSIYLNRAHVGSSQSDCILAHGSRSCAHFVLRVQAIIVARRSSNCASDASHAEQAHNTVTVIDDAGALDRSRA